MNPALRLLEEWTTHQDYVWFLALLAWGGVMGAEYRRRGRAADNSSTRWLVALSASAMLGALLELVLLAQHLKTPYVRLDAAMGAAQAAGTAALIWEATAGVRRARGWRALAIGLLAVLSAARVYFPMEAGSALAVAQVGAVWGVSRRSPRALPAFAGALLLILPVIATHGPWAYLAHEGRRSTDWSHFALFSAAANVAAGSVIAAAAWRRRLHRITGDLGANGTLRRDLRRATILLAAWLVGGVLLAVWYGRIARRAFEENLLRRVDTAVLALDEAAVVEALGPGLRITKIEQRRYPDGRPVAVATVPRTRDPVYAALRAQMARIRQNNPDFKFLYLATWRDGHLLVLNSQPRRDEAITHVIHHDATPADLERLAAGRSFLEGPVTSEGWLPQFSAKAALRDPVTGRLLGWLVADVEATRWMATFTQARLQTMALVGAGVGLWSLGLAYRLRREARDAAEQRAAAAAAANRMKSAFLAKVSHELRTPIQSILGYGELLDTVPLSDAHRAWLTALRSHGDIMLRLVNDLIDLGALQSGSFQLDPAPVALRGLIEECAAALRPAANAKGIAFEMEIAPAVPGTVRVDGVRLRQILLNLLTNAVKFTRAGRVALNVRCAEDAVIEFLVSDTGPGIPVAVRPRLFQPFARLDPAAGEGSGLGLALVQGMCAVMGGSVRLLEGTGAGAAFLVRLPLIRCAGAASVPATAAADGRSLAGIKVLVAEDNTLVRELLMAFLAGNGAAVSVAADGTVALSLAREHPPDVILLDIALPGLDGIAVAEALRRDGARCRIVGLSAHVGAQDEARALRAGMDIFLPKPVSLARLADVILAQPRLEAIYPGLSQRIADERLRVRLVDQFAQETPRLVTDMRAALAAKDWMLLRSRAHYLKNSADVLGVSELQAACHRLASLDERAAATIASALLTAVEEAIPPRVASVNRSRVDHS